MAMLALLGGQVYMLDMPPVQELIEALVGDLRTHLLAILLIVLIVLSHARQNLIRRPAARAAGTTASEDNTVDGSNAVAASVAADSGGNGEAQRDDGPRDGAVY